MGFGNGTFDASRDVASLNFSPTVLRRDTITIQPMGWVVLRFPSDNPGVWIFHCHIEWHLVPGLALIFVEHPEQLGPFVDKLPPDLQGICIVTPAVAPVSASGIGVASNGSLLNLAHP